MQLSRTKFLISTRSGRLLLLFWFGCVIVFLGRFLHETCSTPSPTMIERQGEPYDYLLIFPNGYLPSDPPRPLLIFLHGAGEVAGSLNDLRGANPVAYGAAMVSREDFPFLVVCPKLNDRVWEPDRVIAFLDGLLADDALGHAIDRDRIYLTGFSLGGYGTWQTAAVYPDRFAAVVPVAGDVNPAWADHYGTLPIWTFHGTDDRIIRPEESMKTIEAIRRRRGDTDEIRLTLYRDAGHGIARMVYREPELYRWLLQYRKKASPLIDNPVNNSYIWSIGFRP